MRPLRGKYLNGGASFAVSTVGAPQTVPNLAEPLPLVPIGGKLQVGKKNTVILNPGNVIVRSSGGPEVGSFQATAAMPATKLTSTNRDQILRIDRTKPLTLNWTGAPAASTVAVLGMNSDSSNGSAAFLCVAPDGASSLTVPDYVLAGIPATRQWPQKSIAALFIGALPLAAPVSLTASGLDLGAVFPVVMSAKQVIFR